MYAVRVQGGCTIKYVELSGKISSFVRTTTLIPYPFSLS
jgi:hypothetical protein